MERHEGTPQGGPLSPLLANVLLDDVDKELERRGLHFARYADDCNVYVRSKRAAERVMEALVGLYADLKLQVNVGQERGGAGVGAEVPGLQLLGSARDDRETPRRTESPDGDEGARASDHGPDRRPEHRGSRGGAPELPRGLEGLLPSRGDAERVRRRGQMDPPPTAHAQLKQWKRGRTIVS